MVLRALRTRYSDGRGQRDADARERRAVDRRRLFELDPGERTAARDVGAGVRDADVAQIHEECQRIGPAHRVGDRLGGLDEDRVVLRRDARPGARVRVAADSMMPPSGQRGTSLRPPCGGAVP